MVPAHPIRSAVEHAVPDVASHLLRLQATGGNQMVVRLLESTRGTRTGPDDDLRERILSRLGQGEPLPSDAHAQAQVDLGRPLDSVRVHRDAGAADLADQLGARAFTTGQDIFFGAGEYDPSSTSGYTVLMHELAHTAQQAAGPVAAKPVAPGLAVSTLGDRDERAADQAAHRAVAHRMVRAADADGTSGATAAGATMSVGSIGARVAAVPPSQHQAQFEPVLLGLQQPVGNRAVGVLVQRATDLSGGAVLTAPLLADDPQVLNLQRDIGDQAVTGILAGPQKEEGTSGQRPNLDVGDHGPGVALLHRKLREHGYVVGGNQTEFSQETHNVVVRFQKDHPELHPATGGVGPLTWAILDQPAVQGDVDDTLVKDIIKGALWAETTGTEEERCQRAWLTLKGRRDAEDPSKPGDVNLAAAEHYMFARYMSAGYTPAMAVDMLAIAYYAVKKTGLRWKAGTGPVTPPSAGQLKWGTLGAHDGAWSTIEADKEVPTTNSRAPISPKATVPS